MPRFFSFSSLCFFCSMNISANISDKAMYLLLVAVCLMCFSACDNEPKILYQSESVEVVREGNITLVSDLVADKEYSFRSVRVKRSESVLEPHTAIETDTIKIEIIPSGLRVYDKTANKIFTYQRKSLHNKG